MYMGYEQGSSPCMAEQMYITLSEGYEGTFSGVCKRCRGAYVSGRMNENGVVSQWTGTGECVFEEFGTARYLSRNEIQRLVG